MNEEIIKAVIEAVKAGSEVNERIFQSSKVIKC